jgi:hypothetical protein
VRGVGFFANHDQGIRTLTFGWRAEVFNLVERGLVQMQLVAQCPHVAGLLANDFRRRVLDDSRAMNARIRFSADEIFGRLADAPDARIALARRPK